MFDALFSPMKIRGLELKNRVVLPGMNTKMVRNKHEIGEDMIAYHVAKAKAGCALNIFEVAAVCPEPHAYMYMGLYTDKDVEELRKLTDAVHAVGGKMAIQLWHGGFTPQYFFDESNKLETPDTLSVERLQEIEKQFGAAAKRAADAGFDAVEFHGGHSYLPHEMLSPGTNHRTDEYGGNFENRCRFAWNCIKEIRANIPDSMALFMRCDAVDELMQENMTEQEIVDFINRSAELGVDVVDLSRGNSMSFATVYEVPPYLLKPGFNMDNIAKIKAQVSIPVMGVGRVNTPELADKLIAEGKVDLVGIGRGQITDPQWVKKAQEGHPELIRRCIGCDQGCYDAVIDPRFKTITCTRNPLACLEYKGLQKTESPKKVMIIGGGMGGMMAAEILKARGHEPAIFEASDHLGGQFLLAGVAPQKQEMTAAAEWEVKEVERMGIETHLNTPVTPELIAEVKPDEVIVAIGSDYVCPAIPGAETAYHQYQVLTGEVKLSGNVCVVGCGSVGSEVAMLLAAQGCKVTVMEKKGVGNDLTMLRKMFIKPQFKGFGITGMSGTAVLGIEDGKKVHFVVTDRKTKESTQGSADFDAVVICMGITARGSEDLQAKCAELGVPCHVIGDAKQARTALWATREAAKVALDM
ncbi:MAG TPA: FAD-dependent oxidoreductase [Candidatus Scatomorpha stercoravium]|nr:FAD-dependent oxidoreductase [Candidatus Scatomorpha stercoravium]